MSSCLINSFFLSFLSKNIFLMDSFRFITIGKSSHFSCWAFLFFFLLVVFYYCYNELSFIFFLRIQWAKLKKKQKKIQWHNFFFYKLLSNSFCTEQKENVKFQGFCFFSPLIKLNPELVSETKKATKKIRLNFSIFSSHLKTL